MGYNEHHGTEFYYHDELEFRRKRDFQQATLCSSFRNWILRHFDEIYTSEFEISFDLRFMYGKGSFEGNITKYLLIISLINNMDGLVLAWLRHE